jgi:hypothetical protein
MTPKQQLVAHLECQHNDHVHRGTHQQLVLSHMIHHDKRILSHRHSADGMTTGTGQIAVRIFLSPSKNPSASRNQDRNWVLNVTLKDRGQRWEMAGTWSGDVEGAKKAANHILGYEANWVAVGWGFQHQEVVTS